MAGYDAKFEVLTRRGLLDLRGDSTTMHLCGEALGCGFPSTANSRAVLSESSVLICLSDDHWIFETLDGRQAQVLEQLEEITSGKPHSFVDVSDMYTHIALFGSECREVLAQCVGIDIHPSVFCENSTARCAFADTITQLTCVDDRPTFELSVFSSYERYVCDYLTRAMGN